MADTQPAGQVGLPDSQASEPRALVLACGILQLLMGMAGMVAIFIALRLVMINTNWQVLPALPLLFILLILAGFCIVPLATGIDSIRCRAWVRPVVLGFFRPIAQTSALMLCLCLYGASIAQEDSSYILAAGAAFFLLMPAVLFHIIYRRPDIHELLTANQPDLAWTEQPPEPLFELSLWMVIASVALLLPLVTTLAAPVTPFNLQIIPPPSMAMSLMLAGFGLACLVAAILCFNQHMAGWYLVLALNLAMLISLATPVIQGTGLRMPESMGQLLPNPQVNALLALCIPAIGLFHTFRARSDFFADADLDITAD